MFFVYLRETGAKRSLLLGNGELTNRRLHAVTFDNHDKAETAARWMIDNNPGDFDTYKVARV